jgi:type I restriction enzyme, S subunit
MKEGLPDNWATAILADLLLTLESGSRPRGGVRGIDEGVPSIGGEHLSANGKFDFTSVRYVPVDFATKMSKGRIYPEDILIVKDGATTGKTAFVGPDFPFTNAVVNEHVFICRPNPKINSRFLFRYLISKQGQDQILENFQGSAQGGINQTFAPNIIIPIPPFPEQHRIVAKLEALLAKVDACRQRLEKIPTLLKRFRQSVLAAACSGRLTADWRGNHVDLEPLNSVSERTPPENFKLPTTWDWLLSTNAFSLVTSGSRGWARYYAVTGAKFLRVGNLNHDSIDLDLKSIQCVQPPKNAEGRRTKVQQGDILISITADVGMVALVKENIGEAYINQHVALARPVDNMDRRYLSFFLSAKNGGQEQFLNLQRGATKVGLGLDDIRNIWIANPPIEEQHEIVRRVESLFKIAARIEERYQRAKTQVDKLTQSILAKAFRGELVPQDPNDEPASILLERIKQQEISGNQSKNRGTKRKPSISPSLDGRGQGGG